MTSLAFLIVSGGLPFVPAGESLAQQAREAVAEGLWVNLFTLETGVGWAV